MIFLLQLFFESIRASFRASRASVANRRSFLLSQKLTCLLQRIRVDLFEIKIFFMIFLFYIFKEVHCFGSSIF